MYNEKLKALAAEIAKDLKIPEGLSALGAQLTKITVEAALNAELALIFHEQASQRCKVAGG